MIILNTHAQFHHKQKNKKKKKILHENVKGEKIVLLKFKKIFRLSALECSNENLQIKTNENEENDKMCSNAKEQEINKENPSTSQQSNYKTEKPRIK